jgi:putative glutathione S-transferase
MLYDAFDAFIPEKNREVTKGKAGLFPKHIQGEIEQMNDWVYNTVNNGVYKTGFASTQNAYEDHVFPLFKSLDRLEEHLGDSSHQPYLFGENITEADIRLFTTLIRFDVAYYPIFKCNLKMIRYDYPRLHKWLRTLYWDESDRTHGAFHHTVRFQAVGLIYLR